LYGIAPDVARGASDTGVGLLCNGYVVMQLSLGTLALTNTATAVGLEFYYLQIGISQVEKTC